MASQSCKLCFGAIRAQPRNLLKRASLRYPTCHSFTTSTISRDGTPASPAQNVQAPQKSKHLPPRLRVAQDFKKVAGRTSESYTAYGGTEFLYKECARQADYSIAKMTDPDAEIAQTEQGEDLGVGEGWWYTAAGLTPTFASWSQVTMLHMYLLTAKFRCLEAFTSRTWQQQLIDHFFHDAENRMTIYHGMASASQRNKYLKDLFIQWRGLLAAYDEGLASGDAVLAAAIWRNVFQAKDDIDAVILAQIVSHMRKNFQKLEALSDERMTTTAYTFDTPAVEQNVVALKSKLMDASLQVPKADAPAKKNL